MKQQIRVRAVTPAQPTKPSRLPFPLALLPLFIAAGDVSSRVRVGDYSGTALLTGFVIVIFGLIHISSPRVPWRGGQLWWAWLIWIGGIWIFQPTVAGAVQVALCALAFVLALEAASATGAFDHMQQLHRRMTSACWVLGLIMCIQFGLGLSYPYGGRSVALVALVGVAYSSAHAAAERDLVRYALPLTLIAGLALSGSRTALALAVLIVAFTRTAKRGRSAGTVAWAVVGVASLVALIALWAPLRERFVGGDQGLEVGGIALNTSGRAAFWEPLLDAIAINPWVGHGLGVAEEIIVRSTQGRVPQPHNEYLRLLVDQGVIGTALFGLAAFALILRCVRLIVRDPDARAIHAAAAATMLALLGSMITDNTLIYLFVLAPTGLLTGLSVGLGARLPTDTIRSPIRIQPGVFVLACFILAGGALAFAAALW